MRHSFDPLTFIPSPDAIRKHLAQAECLVKRLRVLLRVAERIAPTRKEQVDNRQPTSRKGAADER